MRVPFELVIEIRLCRWLVSNELLHEVPPSLKRLAFFLRKGVSLINTNNPSEAPRRMIEHLFDDVEVNSQPRHAGRDCPPEIMKRPSEERLAGRSRPCNRAINARFRATKALH